MSTALAHDFAPPRTWSRSDWTALAAVLAGATVVRVLFFSGYFGSDDVSSSQIAVSISNGRWAVGHYLASLRYGISVPIAIFIKIFGLNEFVVVLWPLVCSVAEVGLVFGAARVLWGLKAAILSAAVIGLTPLHVNFGGQPTGDAPLALFITGSVLLFLVAEARGVASWYFLAGLAVGATFWIKESAIIYVGVFFIFALVRRTWRAQWGWAILGTALMIVANGLWFWVLSGDFFYYFRIIVQRRQIHEGLIQSGVRQAGVGESVWMYLYYLFVDLRHTWLIPYLTVAGVIVWLRQGYRDGRIDARTGSVVIWAGGLFAILTFTIIKLQPLTFIFKQTNYMLIFWAPFALLAGFFLASLPTRYLTPTAVVVFTGALALSGLEQQAVRVFTSNSRAAWEFTKQHRDATVYGTQHTVNMATILSILDRVPREGDRVYSLAAVHAAGPDAIATASLRQRALTPAYAVLDFETLQWGSGPRFDPAETPTCWQRVAQLPPTGLGAGAAVTQFATETASLLPASLGARVVKRLNDIATPKPAFVYYMPPDCPAWSRS